MLTPLIRSTALPLRRLPTSSTVLVVPVSVVAARPRNLSTSSSLFNKDASPPSAPTASSRTSPGQTSTTDDSAREHPGYTTYSQPATSKDPSTMEKPSPDAMPSSQTRLASNMSGPAHRKVDTMKQGANETGSDASEPLDRTTKTWGPTNMPAEFNTLEGRRNPVLDGGSHEGGLDDSGKKSKT